jgi:hypothetical protein
LLAGCTEVKLRRSTVQQASTLTELQYQQVLDNLAMFCGNPNAVPWHITIKNGTAQIADTGSAGALLDIGSQVITHPSLLGSRSVVEQWSTEPVTDGTTLRLLQLAYQGAISEPHLLSVDDANSLAHQLSAQQPTTSDMSIDRDTIQYMLRLYAEPAKQVDNNQSPGIDTNAERTIPAQEWIKKVSDHLVALDNEFTETLDKEILVADPANVPYFCAMKRLSSGLAKEVIRQVNDVQSTLVSIESGWFCVGRACDVPKNACHVGCYGDCCVWVFPNESYQLAQFTLHILELASAVSSSQVLAIPSGIQFSPAGARGR